MNSVSEFLHQSTPDNKELDKFPEIEHDDDLSEHDMNEWIKRYSYFFPSIHFSTDINSFSEEKENIHNYYYLLFRNDHWQVVFFSNTDFEYYDPSFSLELEPEIDYLLQIKNPKHPKTIKKKHRGFKKKNKEVCSGLYVLMFIYKKIVEKKSMQDFVDLSLSNCDSLRYIFFRNKLYEKCRQVLEKARNLL